MKFIVNNYNLLTDATVEEIRKVSDFYEKLFENSHNKH